MSFKGLKGKLYEFTINNTLLKNYFLTSPNFFNEHQRKSYVKLKKDARSDFTYQMTAELLQIFF